MCEVTVQYDEGRSVFTGMKEELETRIRQLF